MKNTTKLSPGLVRDYQAMEDRVLFNMAINKLKQIIHEQPRADCGHGFMIPAAIVFTILNIAAAVLCFLK